MKKKLFSVLLLMFTFMLYAQNSFISDGKNGSGIGMEYASGEDGFSLLSGNTAFSIGGVLDIGLFFGNIDSERDSTKATDTSFGLVYNILPIRYNIYMFEAMANIRGAYNYIIVDSDYVDSINGTMEGQGFSIAVEGILEATPLDFISVRAGYHAGYISHLFNTLGNDGGTAVDRTERERNTETGFLTGVSVHYTGFPILAYEILFLDSTQYSSYIKHRISLVIKSD